MTDQLTRSLEEVMGRSENVRTQLLATASDRLAGQIIVDAGSGLLRELLTDGAECLALLTQNILAQAKENAELDAHNKELSAEVVEQSRLLRRAEAKLAAAEGDAELLDWLDANPKVIIRSGKQQIRPLIRAAIAAGAGVNNESC